MLRVTSMFFSKRPYVTYLLIGFNLLMFALEVREGGSQNLDTLSQLGALEPLLVQQGQLWRWVTASFLHYGIGHLSINMLGLFFLGAIAERNFGSIRYLLLYLGSGCGSMALITFWFLSTNQTNQILVGASAAIMGLIGAMASQYWQDWWHFRSRFAARRLLILGMVISLQFYLDFQIPQVSVVSHGLGMILGFLLGLMLLSSECQLNNFD